MPARTPSPRWTLTLPALAMGGLLVACGKDHFVLDDTGAPVLDSAQDSAEDSAVDTTDSGPVDDTDCAEGVLWYHDADNDGYGNESDTLVGNCEQPTYYVSTTGDCDDSSPMVNPSVSESCNGVDDNCDGTADEGFVSDADGDGHRPTDCGDGDDCDDNNATIYPGADDECGDGSDDDCDGEDATCVFDYDGELSAAYTKLYATGPGDDAGRHMDAGDIDGDGTDDVVVGAMWSHSYQGAAWLVSGPPPGESAFGDVAIELTGGSGSYEAGRTVGVDDANDDGYDDVFLGSPDSNAYDAVVFFGPISDDMQFSEADFLTHCDEAVECGHGGDLADVTGDGVADAIIAAGEENTGGYYSGSVYLVFGPLGEEDRDLQDEADAELVGASVSSETGRVVTSHGDLDGDGIGDILITASYDSTGGPYSGAVHVVLGPITGNELLSDAEGKLIGAAPYDYAGESHTMGDLDGDGLCDAIIGSYASERSSGTSYIVLGPATGSISLSDADAAITGSGAEYSSAALASRDVDNDDAYELLIGAGEAHAGGPGSGSAYLFFGPITGSMTTADAFATFVGEAHHSGAGYGVGFADIDGDARADILVGATTESTGAANAGALYMVLSAE